MRSILSPFSRQRQYAVAPENCPPPRRHHLGGKRGRRKATDGHLRSSIATWAGSHSFRHTQTKLAHTSTAFLSSSSSCINTAPWPPLSLRSNQPTHSRDCSLSWSPSGDRGRWQSSSSSSSSSNTNHKNPGPDSHVANHESDPVDTTSYDRDDDENIHDPTTGHEEKHDEGDDQVREWVIPGTTHTQGRRLAVVFTCNVCETRSIKQFTAQAYQHGVVMVQCPGCQKWHVLADRLGYFDNHMEENVDDDTNKSNNENLHQARHSSSSSSPQDPVDPLLTESAAATAVRRRVGWDIEQEGSSLQVKRITDDNLDQLTWRDLLGQERLDRVLQQEPARQTVTDPTGSSEDGRSSPFTETGDVDVDDPAAGKTEK